MQNLICTGFLLLLWAQILLSVRDLPHFCLHSRVDIDVLPLSHIISNQKFNVGKGWNTLANTVFETLPSHRKANELSTLQYPTSISDDLSCFMSDFLCCGWGRGFLTSCLSPAPSRCRYIKESLPSIATLRVEWTFKCYTRNLSTAMKLLITTLVSVLLVAHLQTTLGARDLSATYRFSATLDPNGQYQLYWNYNLTAGTISFAVRVHTTGWVGFGLSPNGQMPGSDVVIGWVDSNGGVHFHVRESEA